MLTIITSIILFILITMIITYVKTDSEYKMSTVYIILYFAGILGLLFGFILALIFNKNLGNVVYDSTTLDISELSDVLIQYETNDINYINISDKSDEKIVINKKEIAFSKFEELITLQTLIADPEFNIDIYIHEK